MDEARVEQLGAKAIEPELNTLKNVKTRDDLAALMGRTTTNFAKMPNLTRVIVAEKSAFPKIVDAYSKTAIDTLRAWQAFHIADNAALYLSKPFTDAYFELHAKTLSGQKEQQVRWKRAITAVSGGDFLVGDRFGTFGTMGFGVG